MGFKAQVWRLFLSGYYYGGDGRDVRVLGLGSRMLGLVPGLGLHRVRGLAGLVVVLLLVG